MGGQQLDVTALIQYLCLGKLHSLSGLLVCVLCVCVRDCRYMLITAVTHTKTYYTVSFSILYKVLQYM